MSDPSRFRGVAPSDARKKELIAKKLKQLRQRSVAQSGFLIPRRQTDGPVPLTHAQKGVWYLEQLEPGTTTYLMSFAWRLRGQVNLDAFKRSIDIIVERHDSLRTQFTTIDGRPMQVVVPDATVELIVKDVDDENEAMALTADESRTPFDLAQAPLIRTKLLRVEQNVYIFLVTMHHIISDGWSFGLFQNELAALYNALADNKPQPALPELPIQFTDFAAWQREQLTDSAENAHLTYWRKQLEGLPAVLELPRDYTRPATLNDEGGCVTAVLSSQLTRALKKLSLQENATLFMMLLAAFKVLLQRHSGQEDIVVGTPKITRERLETENLLGYFLNNLVIRSDLSGEPTFRELLQRVRRTSLDAYDHQGYPFEQLVKALAPERDLSYTPLFQVFFNMFNAFENVELDLAGLRVEALLKPEETARAKFDITMYVRVKEEQIYLNMVYRASLFSQERMQTLLDQYQQLLNQIITQPDQCVTRYSLTDPESEARTPCPTALLSKTWYGAVHEQFSHRAIKQPERIAVQDNQSKWNYGELEQRSNRLAHYLLSQGIQSGDVVAIYSHRSAALIWAWLGVLKAGAAFVNLDPDYPVERLKLYLEIGQPAGLIHIEAAGALPFDIEQQARSYSVRLTLSAGEQPSALNQYPDDPPEITIGPDHLAYLAFTSGSTGLPKGVFGQHGSLSHFLPWQANAFDLSADDRFSLLSGLSHDPLQRDIFTPLWIGARICIPDPESIGVPGYLAEWMGQMGITFSHLTPPMCQILIETARPGARLPSLRQVFFIGDKLTRRDVGALRQLAPDVKPINSYGSTETQRAVGYYLVPPETTTPYPLKAVYPLGQGIPDVQLLILNKHDQLVGVGEVGEIHVRSPHLSRGYVGDDEMTRARFVRNPFTGEDDDRLYKTGDLGRYRPDGVVEFAGRVDRQLKIRGFRVEPGEVETSLREHLAVNDAVVALQSAKSTSRHYLAAWVTAHPSQVLDIEELRLFVAERLPAVMLPSAIIIIESIPLTPNGKIDYSALPPPDLEHLNDRVSNVEPDSVAEREMAELWAQILGVQKVSITTNFFELGGDSLMAVRLLSRIEQQTGQKLSLTTLLQAPTVKKLASQLERLNQQA